MRFDPIKFGVRTLMVLSVFIIATAGAATAPPAVPNPVLLLTSVEPFRSNNQDMVRYTFGVDNFSAFPDAMFAAAPALPPCGKNAKSSRTWVDIFNQQGKRLYGFCALGAAKDLNGIWFALPADEVPPSWVYIELTDRQTSTKYKSNLAETTP
jgi:hypothetical protein